MRLFLWLVVLGTIAVHQHHGVGVVAQEDDEEEPSSTVPLSRAEERRLERERRTQQRHANRERYKERQRHGRQQDKDDRAKRAEERRLQWEALMNATQTWRQAYKAVFPVDPPRHVVEGSWNAATSLAVAGVLGTVSFGIVPVTLYSASYTKSALVGGVLLGSLLSATSVTVGVVTASYQFLWGLLQTPSACIAHFYHGHDYWDPYTHQWGTYSLVAEQETLAHYASNWVADATLYDVLQVPVDASRKDITKSYRRLALQWHPDKNDTPQAADKFFQLTLAYQTLQDDERRAVYDEQGYTQDDEQTFEVEVFFTILFGSQLVEPYVGVLTISTFTSQLVALYKSTKKGNDDSQGEQGSDGDTGTTRSPLETLMLWQDESLLKRRQRQTEIAVNLVKRIDPYGNQDEQEFRDSCRLEATHIAETAGFGTAFLEAIGDELQLQAKLYLSTRNYLAWIFQGGWYWQSVQTIRHAWQTIGSLRKTAEVVWAMSQQVETVDPNEEENKKHGKKASDRQEEQTKEEQSTANNDNDEDEDKKKKQRRKLSAETIQTLLPQIMDMAWVHNVQDISTTLKGACRRIFQDADASVGERTRRAQALRILGEAFRERAAAAAAAAAPNNPQSSATATTKHDESTGTTRSRHGDDEGSEGACFDEEAVKVRDTKARLEVAFAIASSKIKTQRDGMSSEESEEMIQKASQESP